MNGEVAAVRAQRVLEGLNDAQQVVATHPAGPLVVTAGAGTGKTTALTARIAYRVADGQVPAWGVLAVTHSNRAVGQLHDALRRYPLPDVDRVGVRTVHSAALGQLRAFWQDAGRTGELVVCPDAFAMVREIAGRLRVPEPGRVAGALLREIGWAKSTLLTPEQYPAGRRLPVSGEVFLELFTAYEAALRHRGMLDPTDLLTWAARDLDEHPAIAAQVARRAQFVLVDEYQDTDPAQEALIQRWAAPRGDITVVGDPRQAIYQFKGADPGLIDSFTQRYPSASRVELTQSYRSTPQVVAAANRLAEATHPGLAPLAVSTQPGPAVTSRVLSDDSSEVTWVARQVAGLLAAGTRPGQVAVLARTRTGVDAAVHALQEARVPVWSAHEGGFFDRPEIKALRTRLEQLLSDWPETTGASALRWVLDDCGFDRVRPPEAGTAADVVWRSRSALLRWVEAMPSAELISGTSLLAEIDQAAEREQEPAVDAVFAGTVHAAKGLEFDAVFSLGWDGSWQPSGQEPNLAYVALTRARRVLVLTGAEHRAGRAVGPSSMLATVNPGNHHATATTSTGRNRRARTTCERCGAPLVDGAQRLGVCVRHLRGRAATAWVALLAWRRDQATMSTRPPGQVIADDVLLRILANRPTTADELGAITGVGPRTVGRFGAELLAVLAGA